MKQTIKGRIKLYKSNVWYLGFAGMTIHAQEEESYFTSSLRNENGTLLKPLKGIGTLLISPLVVLFLEFQYRILSLFACFRKD